MDANREEAIRLMQEALAGPPGVTQVTGASGQVWQVEREPEPGVRVRLVSVASDERPDRWEILSVEPVEERPGRYPVSLPFVPGVDAQVLTFGKTTTVAWQPPGAAVCAVPELEPDAELQELNQRVQAITDSARRGDRSEREAAGERVKAMIDALPAGPKSKLEELWRQFLPDSELLATLEQLFVRVERESIEDGWRVVERKETEVPMRSSYVQMERDGLSRRIMMMSVSRNVILMQSVLEADEVNEADA